jgi:hypothetical protein
MSQPIPSELQHENQKVLHILGTMKWLNLIPKKFSAAFLNNNDPEVKIRRAMWVLPKGWDSSRDLLELIH